MVGVVTPLLVRRTLTLTRFGRWLFGYAGGEVGTPRGDIQTLVGLVLPPPNDTRRLVVLGGVRERKRELTGVQVGGSCGPLPSLDRALGPGSDRSIDGSCQAVATHKCPTGTTLLADLTSYVLGVLPSHETGVGARVKRVDAGATRVGQEGG